MTVFTAESQRGESAQSRVAQSREKSWCRHDGASINNRARLLDAFEGGLSFAVVAGERECGAVFAGGSTLVALLLEQRAQDEMGVKDRRVFDMRAVIDVVAEIRGG